LSHGTLAERATAAAVRACLEAQEPLTPEQRGRIDGELGSCAGRVLQDCLRIEADWSPYQWIDDISPDAVTQTSDTGVRLVGRAWVMDGQKLLGRWPALADLELHPGPSTLTLTDESTGAHFVFKVRLPEA
jgi:hypothetical protein